MEESIVIVCPDTNIRLWSTAVADGAIRGGKSAILQLAAAWARSGHAVTIFGGLVREGVEDGVRVLPLSRAGGHFDVAVYVTGSLRHFDLPPVAEVTAGRRLLWMNAPDRVAPPPGKTPDWFIAPARFLARRAVDEWGLPASRIVVIPGEAVTRRREPPAEDRRDPWAAVFASHPVKGLRNTVTVLDRARSERPEIRLDVFGSADLWTRPPEDWIPGGPHPWIRLRGDVPQRDVEDGMRDYGFMLYLTDWLDGFSLATAQALASGVLVIATAHGSNAEFIRHGWNGLLVRAAEGQPDLSQAEHLLGEYLRSPRSVEGLRRRAMASVPTWDEQATQWEEVWRSPLPQA
jgi:glycosyltransferase involved in cell wall biosynthesis